jgi:uncharacterized OB-fold protein
MATYPRMYSPYDKTMWDSATEKAMRLQCCASCHSFRYPPGPCCPRCLSTEATWDKISGDGKILSWTTFHRQYLPAYPAPTTIVAVRLAEGPIMISNIDNADVGSLRLDAPVTMIYELHPDGFMLPRFRLAADQPAVKAGADV